MKKLILIGAGGHAKSCIDVIEQENKYQILGLLDIKEKVGQKVFNYKIIGTDDKIEKFVDENTYFLITIGQIKTSELRANLFKKLKSLNACVATVVSPRAYISKYAKIGEGTIVMHNATINAGAVVGNNCTINTNALVEHEAVIEENCHLSTGSIVNGKSIVRKGTFIGSNAVVVDNVEIKEYSFIKAGSLVK